jgi:hypothetical protein
MKRQFTVETSADEGVVAPPFRVCEKWLSAARASKPDEPVPGDDCKDHPHKRSHKRGSSCSEKPIACSSENEQERHKTE